MDALMLTSSNFGCIFIGYFDVISDNSLVSPVSIRLTEMHFNSKNLLHQRLSGPVVAPTVTLLTPRVSVSVGSGEGEGRAAARAPAVTFTALRGQESDASTGDDLIPPSQVSRSEVKRAGSAKKRLGATGRSRSEGFSLSQPLPSTSADTQILVSRGGGGGGGGGGRFGSERGGEAVVFFLGTQPFPYFKSSALPFSGYHEHVRFAKN